MPQGFHQTQPGFPARAADTRSLAERSHLRRRLLLLCLLSGFTSPLLATTITVTNTNDSGAGSLRQAITTANFFAGRDTIAFNIPGPGVHGIQPLTALPSITDPVVIDGFSQPGFTGLPLIVLRGTSVTAGVKTGLVITAGNSLVRGLVIKDWRENGIELAANGGNVVQGNFIGTEAAGTDRAANVVSGVFVNNTPNNLIGGTGPGARNLISGNGTGIWTTGTAATNNVVQGNYIGTDITGNAPLGNGVGILVYGAGQAVIGGVAPGTGNVISGNYGTGVNVSSANGAVIPGNLIGTNAGGTAALANGQFGLDLIGATANTIGGTSAGARNLISGNTNAGIRIQHLLGRDNRIQGNYIGTNATGSEALGNGTGISLESCGPNTIGGAGAGNLISGNGGDGIFILTGDVSSGTVIQGNRIGTNAAGNTALANTISGIFAQAQGLMIGGTAAAERNIISGNRTNGVYLSGGISQGNRVLGNYIGTNGAGTIALANGASGVLIENGTSNTVGGDVAGAANVISGNAGDGVKLSAFAANNTVAGNLIGTAASGNVALANGGDGVLVSESFGNTIGDATAAGRNVISGNARRGIELLDAADNRILGNYIGTRADGAADLGNAAEGVLIQSVAGSAARNVVGGSAAGARNVISGNDSHGIRISGVNSSSTLVQGNFIGTNAAGTAALGNSFFGVFISDAPWNTIGGAAAGDGNVISGGGNIGIRIGGAPSVGTQILGNLIGTNAAGTAGLGNLGDGLFVSNGPQTLIGGTAPGARNIISGNGGRGLYILDTTGTQILGNLIGADITGTANIGNTSHGVHVRLAPGTRIGGLQSGARNTIAFNRGAGVVVIATTATAILSNSFFANGALGIDLGGDGVTPNDADDTDTGPNNLQNFPVLTSFTSGSTIVIDVTLDSRPNTTFTVQLFGNAARDPSGYGEGRRHLGTRIVVTGGTGHAGYRLLFPAAAALEPFISATATDPDGNTSEFSGDLIVPAQPPAPVLSAEPLYTSGTANRAVWSGVIQAAEYYLQWSTNPGFSPVAGNSGWTTATVHVATGLLDGQTYHYRVKCRNGVPTESPWSNAVSSLQDATPPTAPGTPTDLGAFTSFTSVRFNWAAANDSGSGVGSYDLQVGTSPGGSNVFNGNVGNVLTRVVTGAAGQTLHARVRARDKVGHLGPWSGNSNGILIDTVAPQSRVLALPLLTPSTTFTIRAQSSDAAGGVREVRLWYRRGRTSSYRSWATAFTSGTLVFDVRKSGGDGFYQFYSIARDRAGNSEAAPSTPDAETTVHRSAQAGHWVLFR